MSTNLEVYVGPYLRCYPKGACDAYEETGGRLTDLLGESGFICDYDLVGPNVTMEEISRPCRWERTGESEAVVDMPPVSEEMQQFGEQFRDEIAKLREKFSVVRVLWGVVPGWF